MVFWNWEWIYLSEKLLSKNKMILKFEKCFLNLNNVVVLIWKMVFLILKNGRFGESFIIDKCSFETENDCVKLKNGLLKLKMNFLI